MNEVTRLQPNRQQLIKKKLSGFTVIELILALGLTAVIGVSLFAVYNNAVRADVQSRRLYESMIQGHMILRTIEDDVLQAVNYRYHLSGQGSDQLAFHGQHDELSFVKASTQGLQWIEYTQKNLDMSMIHRTTIGQHFKKNQDQILESQSQPSQKDRMFVRRQSQFLGRPDIVFDTANDEVMTRHLNDQGLSFSYGRLSQEGMIWSAQWNDSSLPAAVKVDLKMPMDGQRKSLDFSKVIVLPASL